jgi:uncharacterized cupredoxin-like copper-binding protein
MSVLAGFVLLLAACGGTAQEGAEEFSISIKDEFQYEPALISVPAGQELVITFENTGSVDHSFNILKTDSDLEHVLEQAHDEEQLHEELMLEIHELPPGASETVTFNAPTEPGDYAYFCSVPGHAQAGQIGTLRVTP